MEERFSSLFSSAVHENLHLSKKKKKQSRTKSLLEVALYCFLSILLFISFLFGYCIAATATNAGDMFVGLLI